MGLYGHEIAIYSKAGDSDLAISRVALLFDCLTKAKEYCNAVLTLSFEEMQSWSILEWRKLHHVIISISRILPRIGPAAWNDDSAVTLANFDYLLECLCTRVRGLYLLTNSADEQKTGFGQLLFLWEAIRTSNRATLDLVATPSILAMNWQGVRNAQSYEQPSEPSSDNAINNYIDFGLFEFSV
jgi:hypothetical protein